MSVDPVCPERPIVRATQACRFRLDAGHRTELFFLLRPQAMVIVREFSPLRGIA